jgi:hypothetical protein
MDPDCLIGQPATLCSKCTMTFHGRWSLTKANTRDVPLDGTVKISKSAVDLILDYSLLKAESPLLLAATVLEIAS